MEPGVDSPYRPPAEPATIATGRLKQTPVLLALLFQLITGGIYAPYWYLSRRRPLLALDPSETLPSAPGIGMLLCASTLFVSQLIPIDPRWSLYAQLGSGLFGLYLAFRTKSILEGLYGESLSAVFTFVFNFLYLQYKINELGQPNPDRDPSASPSGMGLSLR